MLWLSKNNIEFPPYKLADKNGIIALGGDLSAKRLIYAYKKGIFPWFCEGDPIVWYCPPKRMVLFPNEVKISKSMRQVLKKNQFKITENNNFELVISYCKNINREKQTGTWITKEMQQAYINLHKKGYAKSVEIWQNEQLVGGLYGVDLQNGVFCGESMFSLVSNASKVAFIYLAKNCGYNLIDCQIYNNHLASLGAKEIDRESFLRFLQPNHK